MGIRHGAESGAAASTEHARLTVVREEPARPVRRPSRRAVFRASVQNSPAEAGTPAASSTEAPPDPHNNGAKALALPGGQAGGSYRDTHDLLSDPTETSQWGRRGHEAGQMARWRK